MLAFYINCWRETGNGFQGEAKRGGGSLPLRLRSRLDLCSGIPAGVSGRQDWKGRRGVERSCLEMDAWRLQENSNAFSRLLQGVGDCRRCCFGRCGQAHQSRSAHIRAIGNLVPGFLDFLPPCLPPPLSSGKRFRPSAVDFKTQQESLRKDNPLPGKPQGHCQSVSRSSSEAVTIPSPLGP